MVPSAPGMKKVTLGIVLLTVVCLVNGHEYNYEVEVHDPQTGGVSTQREGRQGGVTQGKYTVVEKDGSSRKVEYRIARPEALPSIGRSIDARKGDFFVHGPHFKKNSAFENGFHAELSDFRPSQPLTSNPNSFRPLHNPDFNFHERPDYDHFLQPLFNSDKLHFNFDQFYNDFLYSPTAVKKVATSFQDSELPTSKQNYKKPRYNEAKGKKYQEYFEEEVSHQPLSHFKSYSNSGLKEVQASKPSSYSNYITKGVKPEKPSEGGGQRQRSFGYNNSKREQLSDYLANQQYDSLSDLHPNQKWNSDEGSSNVDHHFNYKQFFTSEFPNEFLGDVSFQKSYPPTAPSSNFNVYPINNGDFEKNQFNFDYFKENHEQEPNIGFSQDYYSDALRNVDITKASNKVAGPKIENSYGNSDFSLESLIDKSYVVPKQVLQVPDSSGSGSHQSYAPDQFGAVSSLKINSIGTNVETLTKHLVPKYRKY